MTSRSTSSFVESEGSEISVASAASDESRSERSESRSRSASSTQSEKNERKEKAIEEKKGEKESESVSKSESESESESEKKSKKDNSDSSENEKGEKGERDETDSKKETKNESESEKDEKDSNETEEQAEKKKKKKTGHDKRKSKKHSKSKSDADHDQEGEKSNVYADLPPEPEHRNKSSVRQFRAFFKKCSLAKIRGYKGLITEILSTVILMITLCIGYWADPIKVIDAVTYDGKLPMVPRDKYPGEELLENLTLPHCFDQNKSEMQEYYEGFEMTHPDYPGNMFCVNLMLLTNYRGPMAHIRFDDFIDMKESVGIIIGEMKKKLSRVAVALTFRQMGVLGEEELGKIHFAYTDSALKGKIEDMIKEFKKPENSQKFQDYVDNEVEDEKKTVEKILKDPGIDKHWGVVVFNEIDTANGKIDYKIRMNWTKIAFTEIFTNEHSKKFSSNWETYFTSGFMTLEKMIAEYLVPKAKDYPTPLYVPFPNNSYNENIFFSMITTVFGLVEVIAVLYPASRLVKEVVEEKDSGLKDTLQIMGMEMWIFNTSWALVYFIIFVIIAIIFTLMQATTFLSHTNPFIVFIYNLAFCCAMVAFSMFLASFFSRAKIAGIVAPIIIFASIIPYSLLQQMNASDAIGVKFFGCLLPATAFAFGAQTLAEFEEQFLGISWEEIAEGDFPFIFTFVMLLIDIFVYSILSWYIERIMPSSTGTYQKPWFLFMPSYWCPSNVTMETDLSHDIVESGDSVEPVPDDSKPVVRIRGLVKEFGSRKKKKRAVNELDLTMYDDQLFCLLGHNGAGKSTTISMLTGLLHVTKGDAFINGYSVKNELRQARESVSICPQKNIIYPSYTVLEHVKLVALIKGLSDEEIEKQATQMVEFVGLDDKTHTVASALSGGMKRKLCLAMALVGGSRVVFLDEPTSGMDPQSRRGTWELLKQAKKGRLIVLTTHFMDEADLLGDRIAVMSAGKLNCVGSSLFLKQKYGVGYTLTLAKNPNHFETYGSTSNKLSRKISKNIKKIIPTSEHLDESSREMYYRLSTSETANFPKLFEYLDSITDAMEEQEDYDKKKGKGKDENLKKKKVKKHKHHKGKDAEKKQLIASDDQKLEKAKVLSGYGISMTTLEHVFIKLAEENEVDDEEHIDIELNDMNKKKEKKEKKAKAESDIEEDRENIQEWDIKYETSLPIIHFKEMFTKRFLNTRRDFKSVTLSILLPVIIVILVLAILNFNPDLSGDPLPLYDTRFFSEPRSYMKLIAKKAKDYTEVPYGIGDTSKTSIYTKEIADIMKFYQDQPRMETVALPSTVVKATDVSRYLLDNYYNHHDYNRHFTFIFNDHLTTQEGFEIKSPFSMYFNTTAHHGIPVMMTLLHDYQNKKSPDSYYHLTADSLPMSALEEQSVNSLLNLFTSLMLLIPYCFIASNFVAFLIKERESKAKLLQFTCGVNVFSYWFANLAWDILVFFVIVVLSMIVFAAFGNEAFTGTVSRFFATALLLLVYGFSTMCMAYLLSFLFSSPTAGQLGIAGIMVFFGFALVIVNYILKFVESTQEVNKVLVYFYRIFPPYCFGEGLMQLSAIDLMDAIVGNESKRHGFEWDVTTRDIVLMLAEGALLIIIVLGIDSGFIKAMKAKIIEKCGCCKNKTSDSSEIEAAKEIEEKKNLEKENEENKLSANDSDVIAENEYVHELIEKLEEGTALPDDLEIVIHELTKVFPKTRKTPEKIAVNHVNLTVPKGECFGFLGINGAGKTTTLSMLTHDILPTSGDAYVAGYSITRDYKNMQSVVGYCPQFDPLMDKMTGKEHLRLFGRLKGIPADRLDRAATQLMVRTGIGKHANMLTEKYSGGTKRKLSLAIALIGCPEVVFLDEPSSGMDPVARHQMWDVIKTAAQNKSVTLTTHSMEECEALCTRVGIMVDGQFHCLGSIQHLKSKFGKGYLMEIKTKAGNVKKIKKFITKTFEGSVVTEEHNEMIKFSLQKSDKFSLGEIFSTIESNKEELIILDYCVSQTTLEEVFINVAKMKEAEEEAEKAAQL